MALITGWRSREWAGPVIILLAAAIAVGPQLARGPSCGDDFRFHFVSWVDAHNSWRHGILYPHWTPDANFGAGEPRFVFYPPLTWMLGAALGVVMPWQFVPVVLTFLLLAATGLATRALARETLPEGASTLAGCAVIFFGYPLFGAYKQSVFAWLSGGFWIPLLLLYLLRDRNPSASVWKRAFDKSTLPLALVVAGAWLSDGPVGVMAIYLLAAVAVMAAFLSKSWAPVVRACTGAAAGMSVACFYLVPLAYEQRWVNIGRAERGQHRIEANWLFVQHANPFLKLYGVELQAISVVALAMLGIAIGGLLVCWRRGCLPGGRRRWIPLALIPPAVLFLLNPVSLPVWNALPKLRLLQYPWRWLVVLQAPMAIFFAAAVWSVQLRWRLRIVAACTIVFLAITAATGRILFQRCDESLIGMMNQAANQGSERGMGKPEYAPPGARNTLLAAGLPDACLVSNPSTKLGEPGTTSLPVWLPQQHSCDATFAAVPNAGKTLHEHFEIRGVAPHAGYLILRLRSYPAWRVLVNGRAAGALANREDGLMAMPVPEGPVDVVVDWTTTSDAIAGRWLSGAAVLLLAGIGLLERKLSAPTA